MFLINYYIGLLYGNEWRISCHQNKQLGDRIFEKILSEKNIDAFNGAQGRILYVLWQEDGISIRSLSTKCGLAIHLLLRCWKEWKIKG